ncbi:acetylcholinesterase-1-like [Haemaphysalis longicornis]
MILVKPGRPAGGNWNGFVVIMLSFAPLLTVHSCVVQTKDGLVRGESLTIFERDVNTFLGIPYAIPPLGNLRFLKPKPQRPWQGTYNATSGKPSCMQPRVPWVFVIPTSIEEDCLYLNVWTPNLSTSVRLPVLVWFYGGIFKLGSAYETRYNPSALVALNDVVFVSANFRSAMFGFFDADFKGAPGNVALWDQLLVMRWVRANIAGFGGDPALVTVLGESSSAMDIHLHMMSPYGSGLFQRVFLMSGTESSNVNVYSVFESIATGNKVAWELGCADVYQDLTTHPDKVLRCLRDKLAEDITSATENVTMPGAFAFLPTFKTEYLPYLPSIATKKGLVRRVDAMLSVVANEGAFAFIMQPDRELLQDDLSGYDDDEFKVAVENTLRNYLLENFALLALSSLNNVPSSDKAAFRQAAADLFGMTTFVCPARFFAEKHSNVGATVYGMVFGHRSEKSTYPEWVKVTHMEEIPYFFGIPFLDVGNYTDEDRNLSAYTMKTLVSFARVGQPLSPDGLQWPKFSTEKQNFLWVQPDNYSLIDYTTNTDCDLWREFL